MPQENQRIRITKKMLKDSLIQLLRKESIHKIFVKDICEAAQVNRTTFYKYYGSQYDLLADMEDDVLNQISSYLRSDNAVIDSFQLLIKIMTFIDENINLCRLLLNNNVDPDFPEKLFSLQSIWDLLSQQFALEVEKYNYGKDKWEYFFDFLVNGGFGIMKKWLNKENREPPEVMAVLLNDLIIKLLPTITA
jgi:AcrR family transcriptional regulator